MQLWTKTTSPAVSPKTCPSHMCLKSPQHWNLVALDPWRLRRIGTSREVIRRQSYCRRERRGERIAGERRPLEPLPGPVRGEGRAGPTSVRERTFRMKKTECERTLCGALLTWQGRNGLVGIGEIAYFCGMDEVANRELEKSVGGA